MPGAEVSEKITVNLGPVDLGEIDLLVDEGFYANRTEFIRTAIRRQLEIRATVVQERVARRTLTLGAEHITRQHLESLSASGEMAELRVLGLCTIAADVSAELARATISRVEVLGSFRASKAVKEALADRTG